MFILTKGCITGSICVAQSLNVDQKPVCCLQHLIIVLFALAILTALLERHLRWQVTSRELFRQFCFDPNSFRPSSDLCYLHNHQPRVIQCGTGTRTRTRQCGGFFSTDDIVQSHTESATFAHFAPKKWFILILLLPIISSEYQQIFYFTLYFKRSQTDIDANSSALLD